MKISPVSLRIDRNQEILVLSSEVKVLLKILDAHLHKHLELGAEAVEAVDVDTLRGTWLTDDLLESLLSLFKRLVGSFFLLPPLFLFIWLNSTHFVCLFVQTMTTLIQRNLMAPGDEQETETTLVILQILSEMTKAHHQALTGQLVDQGLIRVVVGECLLLLFFVLFCFFLSFPGLFRFLKIETF